MPLVPKPKECYLVSVPDIVLKIIEQSFDFTVHLLLSLIGIINVFREKEFLKTFFILTKDNSRCTEKNLILSMQGALLYFEFVMMATRYFLGYEAESSDSCSFLTVEFEPETRFFILQILIQFFSVFLFLQISSRPSWRCKP